MATDLEISGSLRWSQGGQEEWLSESAKFTHRGDKTLNIVQEIAVTETPLNLGDISPPGEPSYLFIINLDNANFVSIRPESGATDMIRVDPQKFAGPFRLATPTPVAIADTAPVRVRFVMVENLPDS